MLQFITGRRFRIPNPEKTHAWLSVELSRTRRGEELTSLENFSGDLKKISVNSWKQTLAPDVWSYYVKASFKYDRQR